MDALYFKKLKARRKQRHTKQVDRKSRTKDVDRQRIKVLEERVKLLEMQKDVKKDKKQSSKKKHIHSWRLVREKGTVCDCGAWRYF